MRLRGHRSTSLVIPEHLLRSQVLGSVLNVSQVPLPPRVDRVRVRSVLAVRSPGKRVPDGVKNVPLDVDRIKSEYGVFKDFLAVWKK